MSRSRRLSSRLPVDQAFASPAKTMRIPLNDEDPERNERRRDRNIMHEIHRNRLSFGAASSPRRAVDEEADEEINNAQQQRLHATPKTPRAGGRTRERGMSMMTPMKRAPLVVNFEEWMKMANDNKINATNSWDFALIDYFHDMSLLKEGDSVNFQKASCTLDGCVKIYTSRVDSVATETGKLLSGLADSDNQKKKRGGDEAGEDDEDGSDGEGGVKKPRKRVQKTAESTLAKDFSAIALKRFELEFTVDPLFKKASADFDEGGAKGLLLNHLTIDNNGRIVFDSSDDANDGIAREQTAAPGEGEGEDVEDEKPDINLQSLREMFFPDLDKIDQQEVCPSLTTFDLGDPAGSLDLPFLKSSDDKHDDDDDHGASSGFDGFDDDDIGFPGADGTMAFGEGGDAWASETLADMPNRMMTPARGMSVRPQLGEHDDDDGGNDGFNADEHSMIMTMGGNGGAHADLLSYFDEQMKRDWAGPEHWRVRRLKGITASQKMDQAQKKPRKEKEPFEINFMDPALDISESDLRPGGPTAKPPVLNKKERESRTRNLLPDDKHFNSKQLLRLFLKPKAMLGSRRKVGSRLPQPAPGEQLDEEFWAKEAARRREQSASPGPATYDADFFQEGALPPIGGFDEDDEDHFADAREEFTPPPSTEPGLTQATDAPTSSGFPFTQMDYGSQLVTQGRRVRPEYVQYARVAKKVDVRRLKENLWRDLAFEAPAAKEAPEADAGPQDSGPTAAAAAAPASTQEVKQFTEVVNNLRAVYPKQAMADISTSYCFICVLHLANEKGLVLEGNETLTDLVIRKDPNADGGDDY